MPAIAALLCHDKHHPTTGAYQHDREVSEVGNGLSAPLSSSSAPSTFSDSGDDAYRIRSLILFAVPVAATPLLGFIFVIGVARENAYGGGDSVFLVSGGWGFLWTVCACWHCRARLCHPTEGGGLSPVTFPLLWQIRRSPGLLLCDPFVRPGFRSAVSSSGMRWRCRASGLPNWSSLACTPLPSPTLGSTATRVPSFLVFPMPS